ncbi:MAG: SusE domain-containing protein [Flavobacteriaceae bacterium]|nr:SusE domain-containing protein [Flavobacteriaceae bacterium]
MKKLSILLMAFVALIGLNSCSSDDGVVFIAQPDPEGINFTNSFNESYILTPATSGNIAERFVWNTVDFDVPTNITYQLQGSTSADFSSFDIIGATGENNLGVKVSQLKSLATDAGLDNDANTEAPNTGLIYFRVRAFAGTDGGNGLSEMSAVKSITVILPEGESGVIELPKIFVVGSFLAASGYGADWTPANGVPLAASADGKTDYEGFVYINVDSAEFKFLPSNEGWDGDYGDTGENNGDYSGTIEQEDEVNAGTPDGKSGYFLVKVNTGELKYSLTKTSWGVIGNATPTGWDSDTDMIYDAESKTWSVTLDLTKQEAPDNGIKFRANDDWALNIGDSGADGTMEFGGDNMGISEDGNYTIVLDLSNPRIYTYSITKN